jgi:hypothetical protein
MFRMRSLAPVRTPPLAPGLLGRLIPTVCDLASRKKADTGVEPIR